MKKRKINHKMKLYSLALAAYLSVSAVSIPKIISEENPGEHLTASVKETISHDLRSTLLLEEIKVFAENKSTPPKEDIKKPTADKPVKDETDPPKNEEITPPQNDIAETLPEEKPGINTPAEPENTPPAEPEDEPAKEEEKTENKAITVTATAYCGCYDCNGEWTGYPAADGTPLKSWHTIAADEKFPFGTKVYIPYFASSPNGGNFVVSDRGSAIKGNRIDIYFSSHADALAFGMRELEMYVVG